MFVVSAESYERRAIGWEADGRRIEGRSAGWVSAENLTDSARPRPGRHCSFHSLVSTGAWAAGCPSQLHRVRTLKKKKTYLVARQPGESSSRCPAGQPAKSKKYMIKKEALVQMERPSSDPQGGRTWTSELLAVPSCWSTWSRGGTGRKVGASREGGPPFCLSSSISSSISSSLPCVHTHTRTHGLGTFFIHPRCSFPFFASLPCV